MGKDIDYVQMCGFWESRFFNTLLTFNIIIPWLFLIQRYGKGVYGRSFQSISLLSNKDCKNFLFGLISSP